MARGAVGSAAVLPPSLLWTRTGTLCETAAERTMAAPSAAAMTAGLGERKCTRYTIRIDGFGSPSGTSRLRGTYRVLRRSDSYFLSPANPPKGDALMSTKPPASPGYVPEAM